VDTLDSNSFPRQGIFATAEWTGSRTGLLAADADFDQMRLQTAYAKTWGRHTLLTTMRYDATVSGEAPVYGLFRFGGFLELSGLNHNELTGKYVTQLGTSYYRRIGNLALFPAFAGISVEVGNAWGGRQDISLQDSIWGGSIWAGVDTPVGPVYLGVGTAEGGDQAFYVFLGRLF
jgi:NTE family protein